MGSERSTNISALIQAERGAHRYPMPSSAYQEGFNAGYRLGIDRAAVVAEQAALSGDGTVDQSQYQELQWRRIKMQEMAEEIAALRPTPPEGGRAPQELVAELEEALQRPQTASRYDELLLKCYEALRSRAEPEGERLTPDEEVLVNALRSVVGGAQSPLGLYHLTGLLRILERLRVPGARPDGGRKDDALEIEEDSGRTFHWDDS
jgi:hypothetical protein